MTKLAFVDTETTGLDPERHEVWEVGLILADSDDLRVRQQSQWLLPASAAKGDPMALKVSGFHQRHPSGWELIQDEKAPDVTNHLDFAIKFGKATYGAHFVGAVPSFDDERLRKLLLSRGLQPGWHYHLIDIEAMAVGYLWGQRDCGYRQGEEPPSLPWRSDDLSRACGVEPPSDDERHTALGDARWAYRWYQALVGGDRS